VHGQTQPRRDGTRSVGGYARLATLVGEIRASSKSARVFLVHAGDEFSRGDELTRTTLGAANIAILNHLKFDAWTPGNGDFYDGAATLQARIREAHFPVLAANVKVRATGRPLGRPYVIEQAGPVRVALLGLCFLQPMSDSFEDFRATEPAKTAQELVPELRKQADVVVAMTHLGSWSDRRLAEAVDGIDVIIGGHSHSALASGERARSPSGKEVLICQAGEQLEYLGSVRLRLEKAEGGWRIKEATAQLIPLDEKVKLDPTVTALVARLANESAPAVETPKAETPVPAK